jgi:hypothetical protein
MGSTWVLFNFFLALIYTVTWYLITLYVKLLSFLTLYLLPSKYKLWWSRRQTEVVWSSSLNCCFSSAFTIWPFVWYFKLSLLGVANDMMHIVFFHFLLMMVIILVRSSTQSWCDLVLRSLVRECSTTTSGGEPDGYHLNEKGVSLLAMNIKKTVHHILNIPLPIRRQRSEVQIMMIQETNRGSVIFVTKLLLQ